ncbi:hypothetical protein LPB90_01310 [Chryseobacterium sp. LC2016-29]|uniref:hypothetical protein n=1 Tax=Chryseobacterium sp. LC2016-29 TaxID=2897331 RepID=UPI001E2F2EF7|nr:hypothetical protein [Chryseobacterium sp. LC2016-29]MCD0477074.1 hypothetical protein [Chryseobacterium sp. LC2016-29]
MLQLILMLLGLAFSNGNTTNCNNNNQDPITVQNAGGTAPGTGLGEDGEPVGGNSGQLPPPPRP